MGVEDFEEAAEVSLFDAVKSAQALEKLVNDARHGERPAGARDAGLRRLRVTIENLDETAPSGGTRAETEPYRKGA